MHYPERRAGRRSGGCARARGWRWSATRGPSSGATPATSSSPRSPRTTPLRPRCASSPRCPRAAPRCSSSRCCTARPWASAASGASPAVVPCLSASTLTPVTLENPERTFTMWACRRFDVCQGPDVSPVQRACIVWMHALFPKDVAGTGVVWHVHRLSHSTLAPVWWVISPQPACTCRS